MSRLTIGIDPDPIGGHVALLNGTTPSYLGHFSGDVGEIVDRLLHYDGPGSLVGIEVPSGYIFEHARGAALLATAKTAGRLEGQLRAMGFEVMTASAQVWRKALVGKANANDNMVKTMIRHRIAGWPARSSNHSRDAAGVALWAAETKRLQAMGRTA